MNIALISQGFPPRSTDGVARYNHTLAEEFALTGHKVFVLTESKADFQLNNVVFVDYDKQVFYQELSKFTSVNNNIARSKAIHAKLCELNQEDKIDFVMGSLWDAECFITALSGKFKLITTLVSSAKAVADINIHFATKEELILLMHLERTLIMHSSAIMNISNSVLQKVELDYIQDQIVFQKIPKSFIPIGIDRGFLNKAKTAFEVKTVTKDILFVGRLEQRKGIDILLQAIPKICSAYEDVTFTIVGKQGWAEPDYQIEFAEKYRDQNWFSRVSFLGYVSDDELTYKYAECYCLVVPSRYESFGIIVIEAMAFNKPVVASNVGGLAENVKDSETGYLFESENADSLVAKLVFLLSDSQKYLQMQSKIQISFQKTYSPDIMAKSVLELAAKI